ncbi:MAG: site-2 protease family protein [Victivallales bacterium]|nr:site-2 protease family protein [Victivallales bacterium]
MLDFFSIILKIIFIVFFFGFCVGIHEFGHMIVALWQGLHVEKFSIGMGPKLWGFKYKGVVYQVGWLPFGGFVSLPQLDPTDTPMTSDEKPLPPASPKARMLTAFAGPFFNILFGFVLATIMWGVGLWEPATADSVVVSEVPAYLPEYVEPLQQGDCIVAVNGSPVPEYLGETIEHWGDLCYAWNTLYPDAPVKDTIQLTVVDTDEQEREITLEPKRNPEFDAGLRAGDRIVAVNGKSFTSGVSEFQQEYVYSNAETITLSIVRDGQRQDFTYSPVPNAGMEGLGFPFFAVLNPLQVGEIAPNSPAERAGLEENDLLLAWGGKNVIGARQLTAILPEYAGQTVPVEVSRQGHDLLLNIEIPAIEEVTPKTLGISFHVLASEVMADSPAAQAGLRYGDQFLAVEQLAADGQATGQMTTVLDMRGFQQAVRQCGGNPIRIYYSRNGKESSVVVTPQLKATMEPPTYMVGVVLSDALSKVVTHVNPWTQFTRIMRNTARTLGLLFAPLTSRVSSAVTGKPRSTPKAQIGVKHMSGPLGILQMLWFKLQDEGYRGGFAFIILITFSLAVMNLLPLPVLDGGHILFAIIEAITRRRMPAKAFSYIYNAFAVMLIALMLYITFYDSKRLIRYSGIGSDENQPAVQEKNGHKAPPVEQTKE